MEQKGNSFKALQVLHLAFLTGMILFTVISTFLVITRNVKISNGLPDKATQVIVLLLAISLSTTGFFLFNKRIQSVPTNASATERMDAYRSAAILRWALIECPSLLAIIAFFITGNYAFVALAIALMILFASTAPVKSKIIQLLQLDDNEVAALEGSSE